MTLFRYGAGIITSFIVVVLTFAMYELFIKWIVSMKMDDYEYMELIPLTIFVLYFIFMRRIDKWVIIAKDGVISIWPDKTWGIGFVFVITLLAGYGLIKKEWALFNVTEKNIDILTFLILLITGVLIWLMGLKWNAIKGEQKTNSENKELTLLEIMAIPIQEKQTESEKQEFVIKPEENIKEPPEIIEEIKEVEKIKTELVIQQNPTPLMSITRKQLYVIIAFCLGLIIICTFLSPVYHEHGSRANDRFTGILSGEKIYWHSFYIEIFLYLIICSLTFIVVSSKIKK